MLLTLLAGCLPAPEYVYGQDLDGLRFELYSLEMGVHPDTSLLDDPNNPFRGGVGEETKWDILAADCLPGFYAFGTALATQPTGEHQLYTAQCLHELYDTQRAEAEDLYYVRDLALRGYEQVALSFPDSESFLADGVTTFPLLPLACAGIDALGGELPEDCG